MLCAVDHKHMVVQNGQISGSLELIVVATFSSKLSNKRVRVAFKHIHLAPMIRFEYKQLIVHAIEYNHQRVERIVFRYRGRGHTEIRHSQPIAWIVHVYTTKRAYVQPMTIQIDCHSTAFVY